MINANELRIGNLLIDQLYGTEVTVNNDVLKSIERGNDYEPIPLTEEILWKCSLSYEKNRSVFSFPAPRLMEYEVNKSQGKGYSLGINYGTQSIYFHWELVYLHQLQNLYFALTGKELVYMA